VAKPCRAIKRNSIRDPDKLKIWWGKGESNEVFIMNFKEIHLNMEFLSTYRRARACSCRNKIENTFIEKWLEHSVQATRKIRNLSHFLEVSRRVEIYNCFFI